MPELTLTETQRRILEAHLATRQAAEQNVVAATALLGVPDGTAWKYEGGVLRWADPGDGVLVAPEPTDGTPAEG